MPDPFGSPDRLRSIEEALRRYRPDLYPQKSAYPQGFDLDHAIDTDDVGAIANQFASGLLSGFSGLGNYADEPRTQWESIANSFGSVLGFMGILIPGTAIFKGVGLGLKGLSLAAGATKVAGAARVAEGIYGLGRGIEKSRSIPLLVGEVGWKALERRKAGQIAMEFLAKKNPLYAHMAEEGTRLAIASAFPSLIQEGVGSALESAAYGFATAGLMGVGVGNLPFLKEAHVATFLRAMAGAITQTVMVAGISGMNPLDMPTEELVYESLLGAYFGSKAVSSKTYMASREWNRIFEKNGRQPLAMRYSQDQSKAYNTLPDWQDVHTIEPGASSGGALARIASQKSAMPAKFGFDSSLNSALP